MEPKPTTRRYHTVWQLWFTQLVIRDDKEAGSRDWRVKASFGKHPDIVIVNNLEGATGQTLGLPRTTYTCEARSFNLSARVEEHDGGIGAKSESVGHKETLVSGNGLNKLEFKNAEGHVELNFEVRDIGYWE